MSLDKSSEIQCPRYLYDLTNLEVYYLYIINRIMIRFIKINNNYVY